MDEKDVVDQANEEQPLSENELEKVAGGQYTIKNGKSPFDNWDPTQP